MVERYFGIQSRQEIGGGFLCVARLGAERSQVGTASEEKLGEPLNFDKDIRNFKMENNSVQFEVPVSGSKGNGILHVESNKQGDDWKLTKLQLKMSDGQVHDLDVNAANAAAKDPTSSEIPLPGSEEEMPEDKK